MSKTFKIGDFVVGYNPEKAFGVIIGEPEPGALKRVEVWWLDGHGPARIKEPLDSLKQCWREWVAGVREDV